MHLSHDRHFDIQTVITSSSQQSAIVTCDSCVIYVCCQSFSSKESEPMWEVLDCEQISKCLLGFHQTLRISFLLQSSQAVQIQQRRKPKIKALYLKRRAKSVDIPVPAVTVTVIPSRIFPKRAAFFFFQTLSEGGCLLSKYFICTHCLHCFST